MDLTIPESVLAHYRDFTGRPHRPFGAGLINSTFLVEGLRGPAIVQRLHPVFAGVVKQAGHQRHGAAAQREPPRAFAHRA